MHGAGFTGSGEDHLASIVTVEADADGRVRVLAASTEIGQGTNTIFSQIAADALGLEVGAIEVVQPDTAVVPNSGPTVASRTCMVVGKLVESAALELRATLERKLGERRRISPPPAASTSRSSGRCAPHRSIARTAAPDGTTSATRATPMARTRGRCTWRK